MREIKFRAWDDGSMVFSEHFQDDRDYSEYDYLRFFFKRIRGDSLVMQYTGLKDKNGKDIYEGDIVEYNSYFKKDHKTGSKIMTVIFLDASFQLQFRNGNPAGDMMQVSKHGEVIGNIHENPELTHQP